MTNNAWRCSTCNEETTDANKVKTCEDCGHSFCLRCIKADPDALAFVKMECCGKKVCRLYECCDAKCDVCEKSACTDCLADGCKFDRNCKVLTCKDCWHTCDECNRSGCGKHYFVDGQLCNDCSKDARSE